MDEGDEADGAEDADEDDGGDDGHGREEARDLPVPPPEPDGGVLDDEDEADREPQDELDEGQKVDGDARPHERVAHALKLEAEARDRVRAVVHAVRREAPRADAVDRRPAVVAHVQLGEARVAASVRRMGRVGMGAVRGMGRVGAVRGMGAVRRVGAVRGMGRVCGMGAVRGMGRVGGMGAVRRVRIMHSSSVNSSSMASRSMC